MAINIKRVVSNFKTTLSSSMTDTVTSMTLAVVPAGTIQYPNWFIIEPKSANFEIVYCATAPSGTTFSSIVRGVSASADSDLAGTGLAHPANVDVVLAPMHRMHNSMADVFNAVDPAPAVMLNPTVRTISNARHLIDKEYADSITVGTLTAFLVTQNGADPSLTINVGAGQFILKDGTTALFIGASASAVTASQTNYVELNPNTNLISINTSAFTANNIPLAIVTTNVTDITVIADRRAWLSQNDGLVDKIRTWSTVQSLTADNLQVTSDANSANDAVRSSYLDAQIATATLAIPLGAVSGTSGEAITAGQGVYIKASDGKAYKTLGTGDESTFSFVGVALTTVAGANLTVTYAPPGHTVTGLTGLVAGSFYFVTDVAGTLTTTPGTRFARVGMAISTTALLVNLPKYKINGNFTVSATGNTSVTTGFYPAIIRIRASRDFSGMMSYGEDDNNCVHTACGNINIVNGYSTGNVAFLRTDVSTFFAASISARSSTGFTFNTSTGSANNYVYWTAESL